MSNKINVIEKVKANVDYKGAVTIECYDIINGKRIIDVFNQGEEALFNSIVKFLGNDGAIIPNSIDLCEKVAENLQPVSVLATSIPYLTKPLYYHYDVTESSYEPSTDGHWNCIMFSFIIPKGSFIKENGTVNHLRLLGGNNSLFASVDLSEEQSININNSLNIQIYWRLIFS